MAIKLEKIDINLEKGKIGVNMNFDGKQVRHVLDGQDIINTIFKSAQEDYREFLNNQLSDLLAASKDERKEKAAK